MKNSIAFIVLFVSVAMFASSCSTRDVIVTQEVYIPVKCKAELPDRPISKSYAVDVVSIIEYAEALEKVVQECVEEK